MCGIIGSFSKNKIIELSKINSARGNKTYSLTVLSKEGYVISCDKQIGEFNQEVFEKVKDINIVEPYYILHIQSPTKVTKLDKETIHPAKQHSEYTETIDYLWHNGMIIERNMNIIKEKYSYDSNWDTGLILKMVTEDIDTLEEIEGSFGCLLLKDNNFYIFRNNIVPMYYDDDLNISSTEFENSTKLHSNIVYDIDLKNKKLNYFKQFKNEHNPYKF